MSKWKTHHSSAALFLIEIIVALGFFSMACAVCVQLFVRSHFLSIQSSELTHSVIAVQSAAEAYKASGGNSILAAEMLDTVSINGEIKLCYDSEWNLTAVKDQTKHAYCLVMKTNVKNKTANISISRSPLSKGYNMLGDGVIYSLDVKAI